MKKKTQKELRHVARQVHAIYECLRKAANDKFVRKDALQDIIEALQNVTDRQGFKLSDYIADELPRNSPLPAFIEFGTGRPKGSNGIISERELREMADKIRKNLSDIKNAFNAAPVDSFEGLRQKIAEHLTAMKDQVRSAEPTKAPAKIEDPLAVALKKQGQYRCAGCGSIGNNTDPHSCPNPGMLNYINLYKR